MEAKLYRHAKCVSLFEYLKKLNAQMIKY